MVCRTEFTTKNGLVLPLLNLKGKEYLLATWRLVWFENENPYYTINNEIVDKDDEKATCKCTITILDKDGKTIRCANGFKTEHKKEFADYLEKASTGAQSRTLLALGYGTSFSGDELNEIINEKGIEVNRLADAPVEPKPVSKSGFKKPELVKEPVKETPKAKDGWE